MTPLFISLAGLIGVGKTTLSKTLGKYFDLPVYEEPVFDGDRLSNFYADMKTNGFSFQMYLLNKRFAQHQQIIWNKKGAVQDRTIYEDQIFAKMLVDQGHMRAEDFEIYQETSLNMFHFMQRPNLILYLDVSPEMALARIEERGRECEKGITLEYLTDLKKGYDKFMTELSKTVPVYRVDWSTFENTEETAKAILDSYQNNGLKTLTISK